MKSTISLANFHARKFEVNLTVDTSAYASGDLLSDRVEVSICSLLAGEKLQGEVIGITLLDKDDEGAAIDLIFLDSDVSLGTINSAPTLSDANAQAVFGAVSVTSYTDLGGCRVANPYHEPLPFESADGSIYVAAIVRGAPTYTAATDLRLKLLIQLHNVNL